MSVKSKFSKELTPRSRAYELRGQGEKKQRKSCIRIKDKQTPHTASPLNVVLENCANVVIHPSVLFRKIVPIFTSLFQEVLRRLSSCIRGTSKNAQNYKNQSADDTDLTELLEWVGWVCGETEEFPHLL